MEVVFAFLPLMQKSQEEPVLNSPSATLCPVTLFCLFFLSDFYFISIYFYFYFYFLFSLSSLSPLMMYP
ncbi:hypothetical protein BDV24DRAFT_131770 [Aspergillus arachidicola]|uniref:Uncharacterized protein n=1 Tax=Aspergillus arachidicola TaxID=656916 RepID=A0A5N6Y9Y8_9EURO|nr:hypothetical protein BDV24DRAFT_131770 [Aspergillus arachidicola]